MQNSKDADADWTESIKFIVNTYQVCDFYTNENHIISFNKQGTLCFNRVEQWCSLDDKRNHMYNRVDLDVIICKLADVGLESVIKTCTAFSIHSWHFLEYLDGLGLLDKITYLAYRDPYESLPIKYIKKMNVLRILIIENSRTSFRIKPTNVEQESYKASLEELVIQLPPTLEILFIHSLTFNGSLANLPHKMRILCIISNLFNQTVDYLPHSLEVLLLLQLSNYKHNIQSLPPFLKMLALEFDDGRYDGLVRLPPHLEYLELNMRVEESFIAAIGGYDGYNITNLKKLIVASNIFIILDKIKLSECSCFKNIQIKNADVINYNTIIEELMQ